MRTIKFRGKCVADSNSANEWVFGGYSEPHPDVSNKDEGIIVCYLGDNCKCIYHVYPSTVGQFTGVHDKNGVEIYEGDIIRAYDSAEEPLIHQIYYLDREARFATKLIGYDELNEGELTQRWVDEIGFEVVGNIFDNPELLK